MKQIKRRDFLKTGSLVLPLGLATTSRFVLGARVAEGRKFFVDGLNGDDKKSGLTEAQAWKTLDRVNRTVFRPGDQVLLKSGTRFEGQLAPQGSGEKGSPVSIDQYGRGPKPLVEAGGRFGEALLLDGQEYWEARNLQLTNRGENRKESRYGVRLNAWDCGTMHHIVLQGLEVRDVNGSLVKNRGEGQGIVWENGGKQKQSRFDGLLIEDCHLVRTDRNGICGFSGHSRRSDWYPSLNVVIRNNVLEDIGGDCIKPWGCEGALVEHNVVRGGRTRCKDAAAGIWPWSCDNTVVQFNEVSGVKGKVDGQGFDSDFNCRNSLFQYNYSHDNEGGFFLVCTPKPRSEILGNEGTIIRYNISQNDGTRAFHMAGPARNTHIYNNTIYVGEDLDVHAFLFTSWGGWSEGTRIQNNIFFAGGTFRYSYGGRTKRPDGTYTAEPGYGRSSDNLFSHNVFFGNHSPTPEGPGNLTIDPGLLGPGTGGAGFESLEGYKLSEDSPCRGAGTPVKDNGNRDFWGNQTQATPSIGANSGA